jgi:hypothetical protein
LNGILRANAQAIPKATIYRVAAGVALGSAALAFGIAFIGPSMGSIIGYAVWPILVALVASVIAGILRLRLVGYLPSQPKDDDLLPRSLQPWIRFWLLARFGLLGAGLVLSLAIVAAAIAGRGLSYAVAALVYLVMTRALIDLGFGAAFNFGIISRRRNAS